LFNLAMAVTASAPELQNFVNGEYKAPLASRPFLDVTNPADGSVIAKVPLCIAADVDDAVSAAKAAHAGWAGKTVKTRVQCLFKLKSIMEAKADELVDIVVKEHGKTRPEAMASLMKGIETLEYACSMPQLIPGRILDVSTGVQCRENREPLGVVASVVPFNFPVMVPFWTVPVALACGNCVILKPSEKVPMTMNRIAQMIHDAGVPSGVFNVVNGAVDVVNALVDHPDVKAFTFVGSTPVAKLLSQRCRAIPKKALCLGGAKNHLVVLPDADIEMTTGDIINSFAGSAGQRCMAASVMLMIGEQKACLDRLCEKAAAIKPGQGAGEGPPVIDEAAVTRITRYINEAEKGGARVLVDGRSWTGKVNDGKGFWVGPTIIQHFNHTDAAMKEEIFGPVLSVYICKDREEAIAIENASPFGNAASIYTSVGQNADWFTKRFDAAMIGVNIGVPVPREPFAFGGWNDSKFGDMDITGDGGIEFFTKRRKITTKWVPQQGGSVVESSFIR
jgi:methylmalonic acid semialdehyde dehydrogenase